MARLHGTEREDHREGQRLAPPTRAGMAVSLIRAANRVLGGRADVGTPQTPKANRTPLAAGTPKKVALTACMRKLLVILNSMLKWRSLES